MRVFGFDDGKGIASTASGVIVMIEYCHVTGKRDTEIEIHTKMGSLITSLCSGTQIITLPRSENSALNMIQYSS